MGVGAFAGVESFKFLSLRKKPDLAELHRYKPLIAELAETIIPATDTPGAKDVKAEDCICALIQDCSDRTTQNKFIYGLEDLESYSHSEFGNSFIKCNNMQRNKILQHFEDAGKPYKGIMGKVQNKFFGKSFFTTLKIYTAIAYCTSMEGATKGLAYDYIPGGYGACIPIMPGQKSWATK